MIKNHLFRRTKIRYFFLSLFKYIYLYIKVLAEYIPISTFLQYIPLLQQIDSEERCGIQKVINNENKYFKKIFKKLYFYYL